jgi:hypothetical protein
MLTSEERREKIEKIRRLPAELEAVVSDLTLEQLTTPYLGDEWTVAQVVHHLADSHMNSFVRLKLILTEDRPTLKAYNEAMWARAVDANNPILHTSLILLKGLHQRWVTLLDSLAEEDFRRTGYHPELGEISVDDLVRIYAKHGDDHIEQIRRVLTAGAKG